MIKSAESIDQYEILTLPNPITWPQFRKFAKIPENSYWPELQIVDNWTRSSNYWRNFFVNCTNPEQLETNISHFAVVHYYFYCHSKDFFLNDLRVLTKEFNRGTALPMVNFAAFVRSKQCDTSNFYRSDPDRIDPDPELSYFWRALWFLGAAFDEELVFHQWSQKQSAWSSKRFCNAFVRACLSYSQGIRALHDLRLGVSNEMYQEYDQNALTTKAVTFFLSKRPELVQATLKVFNTSLYPITDQVGVQSYLANSIYSITSLQEARDKYPIKPWMLSHVLHYDMVADLREFLAG